MRRPPTKRPETICWEQRNPNSAQTHSVEGVHVLKVYIPLYRMGDLKCGQLEEIPCNLPPRPSNSSRGNKTTALNCGTITSLGVRADLAGLPLQEAITARRLGCLKRILDSKSEWCLV